MANQTLQLVQIKKPCDADWDLMAGDDQKRFCSHCQKRVHNLSMMSSDAAERLVCQSAGKICIRFARIPDGSMLTLDYQPQPKRKNRFWPTAIIAAITTTIAGAFISSSTRPVAVVPPAPKIQPIFSMGDMEFPQMPSTPTTHPTAAANQGVSLTDEDYTAKP